MISIGEFSRVSSLTVKTLRYYHEVGILVPEKIDEISGYRYYGKLAFSRAETIGVLKTLGFTITEIKKIFTDCKTDEDLNSFIAEKIKNVDKQIKDLKKQKKTLDFYSQAISASELDYNDVLENTFGDFWVCSIRFKGVYSDIGFRFRTLYKNCGQNINGKSMGFYYDKEFKEKDADIEAVIPVSKKLMVPNIDCRKIEMKRSVSIIHKGPYGTQGSSYLKLFSYCDRNGYKIHISVCI